MRDLLPSELYTFASGEFLQPPVCRIFWLWLKQCLVKVDTISSFRGIWAKCRHMGLAQEVTLVSMGELG